MTDTVRDSLKMVTAFLRKHQHNECVYPVSFERGEPNAVPDGFTAQLGGDGASVRFFGPHGDSYIVRTQEQWGGRHEVKWFDVMEAFEFLCHANDPRWQRSMDVRTAWKLTGIEQNGEPFLIPAPAPMSRS